MTDHGDEVSSHQRFGSLGNVGVDEERHLGVLDLNLAGSLVQVFAETLASLVMVNVIKPGHPMVFSNWPLVIDLRTGAFAGGGGEIAVLNAASAQVSNWLGLPSGVACSMTDAKAIDAQ